MNAFTMDISSKITSLINIPLRWFNSINNIRNKLLLVLLVVTLLPTLLIGGYAVLFTTDALHKSSLSIHATKIDLISEKILSYLEQVNSDLFYLRDSNALNLYLSSLESDSAHKKRLMLTNFRSSLNKFASQKKNYQQIRFIHSDGMEVAGIDYVEGMARNLTDADLHNINNRAYFQNTKALSKDDLSVTVLQSDRVTVQKNLLTINYSTSVYSKENEFLGVISLNVDMKKIMSIIAGETQQGTQIQFVNPDGFFYFYADGGSQNSNNNLFTTKQGLRKLIQNTASGSLSFDNDIVTYKTIKIDNNKFNLGLIFDFTPENQVFKEERRFLYIFISVILLALILTLILAVFLSNSITQPIIALTDDVDRLSKGDLEKAIVLESDDEIGTLAIAIERLRKSIKILMKRLA